MLGKAFFLQLEFFHVGYSYFFTAKIFSCWVKLFLWLEYFLSPTYTEKYRCMNIFIQKLHVIFLQVA